MPTVNEAEEAGKLSERTLGKVLSYSHAPFSNEMGIRRSVILADLYLAGLEPAIDDWGNIIVVKPSGKKLKDDKLIVVSSHMDTVFGLKPAKYRCEVKRTKEGTQIMGTIDNSVCCAVNAELAQRAAPKYTTIFAFTVGEEPPHGCTGAYALLRNIENANARPDLVIALDVTYPERDFVEPESGSLFDLGLVEYVRRTFADNAPVEVIDGSVQACAENFSDIFVEKLIREFLKGMAPEVIARSVETEDEATVYGARANAFAFGPVTFGKMHEPECKTRLESLEACIAALKQLLEDDTLQPPARDRRIYAGSPGFRARVTPDDKAKLMQGEIGLRLADAFSPEIAMLVGSPHKAHDFNKKFLGIEDAEKEARKNGHYKGKIEMPFATLVAYAISDDIEALDGFVFFENGFLSFISGSEEQSMEEFLKRAVDKGCFRRQKVNIAPEGEKEVLRWVYTATKKGMETVTLDYIVWSKNCLHSTVDGKAALELKNCRASADRLMKQGVVYAARQGLNGSLMATLYSAHASLVDAALRLNHYYDWKGYASDRRSARGFFGEFLNQVHKHAPEHEARFRELAAEIMQGDSE